jgi:hypothetical protein
MAHAHSPLLFIISDPVGSPMANEVAARLADQGVRTWIGSLAPAGELSDEAMDALRSSAATLLVFDRSAAASRDVDRHLLVARQTGKPLIPLRVEPADEGLLRQELLGARWIDWSSPEAAVAEIRRRAYEYDSARAGHAAQPGHAAGAAAAGPAMAAAAPPAAGERSKPRIEVLQPGLAATAAGAGAGAGAAAAAAAPVMAPGPSAATQHRAPSIMVHESSERPAPRFAADPPPAAAAAPRRRPLFASPTMLLALLALAAILGAILYNSSLFSGGGGGGREEREVAGGTETETPAPPEPAPGAATAPASEGSWGPASEGTEPDLPAAPEVPAPAQGEAATASAAREAEAAPAPREGAVAEAPRAPVAAPPAPAPAGAAAAQPAAAAATVRSFYSALSGGNGAAAAQLVVPAKRGSGPLSAGSLTRYYSSFRRPLRIRSVTPVDADTVRVAYDYVLSDGRLCEGQASVNVVQSGGRSLVSGIRTRGPC